MKRNPRNMKNFLKIIFVLVVFVSCREVSKTEYNISDKGKNLVPYSGGETLIYKLNGNDTIMEYTVVAPESFYFESASNYSPIYAYEHLKQKLQSENSLITIHLVGGSNGIVPEKFDISWVNSFEGFPGVYCDLLFPLENYNNSAEEIGILEVSGQEYDNVIATKLSFPYWYSDSTFTGLTYPSMFYFSPGYGIIRMDMSDSTYLELTGIE